MAEVVIKQGGDMIYRHLTLDDGGYTELLGTAMALTRTQYRLLRCLMEQAPAPVPAQTLSDCCLHTGSLGQICVQVHHINTVAQSISGRKLILNRRGTGYYLNPWM